VKPKAIAIVLVVLVGGAIAYDVKFLINRSRNKPRPPAPEVGEEDHKHAEAEVPSPASAPKQIPGKENATTGKQAGRTAEAASQQHAARAELAAKLPAIFGDNMPWVDPFNNDPPAAGAPRAGSQGAKMVSGNSFANRSPVVSAVLIGRTGRCAVINGWIVREGNEIGAANAVVTAITAEGVEVKAGDSTQFLPVGGGPQSTARKAAHGTPCAAPSATTYKATSKTLPDE